MYTNVLGMTAVFGAPGVVAALIETGLRAVTSDIVQPDLGRRCRVTDQVNEFPGSSTTLKEHTREI